MSKGRILVIEDDTDNLELVAFLLQQAGYEVLEAHDGRSGMEAVITLNPDLVLLDMGIPEVDGWKVASQLRENPATRTKCIVALTGHTAPGDRKKALDAGCDGYITKPLDLPNFVPQVTEYLEKHKS